MRVARTFMGVEKCRPGLADSHTGGLADWLAVSQAFDLLDGGVFLKGSS